MQKVIFGTPQAKVFLKEKFEKEKKISEIQKNLSLSKLLVEDEDYHFYLKEIDKKPKVSEFLELVY